jgi:uncharacterized protein YidB (DUF937 family)
MALLGLLAYKAMKHFAGSGSQPTTPAAPPQPPPKPPSSTTQAGSGGGLGDILGGILGGQKGGTTPAGGTTQVSSTSGLPGGLGDILGGMLGGKAGAGQPGGSLGDLGNLIPGGLGGLLGGAAAGTVLNGGLGNLIKDLQGSGHGATVQSWVGSGDNKDIEPNDLGKALGADTIQALTEQTGMSRDELLKGLSQHLPELINQLTPDGRLPTDHEAARW